MLDSTVDLLSTCIQVNSPHSSRSISRTVHGMTNCLGYNLYIILCSTTLVTTLKVTKIEEDEVLKKISICVIFDLYISWRGHGMSSLQTHSNCSVLQLTVSNAVHNPLFDVIRWLEGQWGRVSLLCVVTAMSQDKAGHVALCWAPASSNRLILLLYPVSIPSDSFVSRKFPPIR